MKNMKISWISVLIIAGFVLNGQAQVFIGSTEVDTTSVATGLDVPWEILWGPDDHIWFTERYGRISRLNPETGDVTELIIIGDVYEEGEGGLLGMVLHPDFANHPYVYVVYNYMGTYSPGERLVRYTYSGGQLTAPLTLLEGINGSYNHNGSRLVIDADQKLYMTTGDVTNTDFPQDLNSLNGKVLRLNLDGSVPGDNPFQGSYVWTWGHRNAQGLVISPLGLMYSSEHGTSTDDELNIIEKGRNYGWPHVEGFCSDPSESQFCSDFNVMEPITAWTPTLAVAGTDFYHHASIPEWQNSLLIATLRASSLVALKLTPEGRSVISEEIYFENDFGRLRDICVSPDGRVFLAVSNRDVWGTPRDGDDRIIEISALGSNEFCTKEEAVSICSGETYNFNGQEISQPGIYTDTISGSGACDTIVSLSLTYFDESSIGLENSVTLTLDETVTLTANAGFVSYMWNDNPALDERSITIVASELGIGTYYYSLEVENATACILRDTTEVIITYTTGVPSESVPSFSVYPNPVSGEELHIDYRISSEASLLIYSQDGRLVSRTILSPGKKQTIIQLPETGGIFNLIISNKEGTSFKRVLKL